MAQAKAELGEAVLEVARELEEDYRDVLDRRAANRRSLRDLATQGLLTDPQVKEMDTIYPPRERSKGDNGGDNA